MAGRVRRPRARADRAGDGQPGDRARRGTRDPRRDRDRDARAVPDRARQRRAEEPPPRSDAPRRRGLVPDVLRARRRLGPGRGADPRAPERRRHLDAERAEGVDHQRPVRLVRAAARAHRPRRPQAQGPDDVHRADGRTRGDGPGPAPDLRRGRVQRGVLRRRHAGRGRGGRRGRKRLGHGADRADVRALDDRLRIGVVRLAGAAGGDGGRRPGGARRRGCSAAPGRRDHRAARRAVQRLPCAHRALPRPDPRARGGTGEGHDGQRGDRRDRSRRRRRRTRRRSSPTATGAT